MPVGLRLRLLAFSQDPQNGCQGEVSPWMASLCELSGRRVKPLDMDAAYEGLV